MSWVSRGLAHARLLEALPLQRIQQPLRTVICCEMVWAVQMAHANTQTHTRAHTRTQVSTGLLIQAYSTYEHMVSIHTHPYTHTWAPDTHAEQTTNQAEPIHPGRSAPSDHRQTLANPQSTSACGASAPVALSPQGTAWGPRDTHLQEIWQDCITPGPLLLAGCRRGNPVLLLQGTTMTSPGERHRKQP